MGCRVECWFSSRQRGVRAGSGNGKTKGTGSRDKEGGSHRHILPGRVHRNEVEAGGAVDLEIVPIRFQGRSEVGSGDPGEAAGVPRCAEALPVLQLNRSLTVAADRRGVNAQARPRRTRAFAGM